MQRLRRIKPSLKTVQHCCATQKCLGGEATHVINWPILFDHSELQVHTYINSKTHPLWFNIPSGAELPENSISKHLCNCQSFQTDLSLGSAFIISVCENAELVCKPCKGYKQTSNLFIFMFQPQDILPQHYAQKAKLVETWSRLSPNPPSPNQSLGTGEILVRTAVYWPSLLFPTEGLIRGFMKYQDWCSSFHWLTRLGALWCRLAFAISFLTLPMFMENLLALVTSYLHEGVV